LSGIWISPYQYIMITMSLVAVGDSRNLVVLFYSLRAIAQTISLWSGNSPPTTTPSKRREVDWSALLPSQSISIEVVYYQYIIIFICLYDLRNLFFWSPEHILTSIKQNKKINTQKELLKIWLKIYVVFKRFKTFWKFCTCFAYT